MYQAYVLMEVQQSKVQRILGKMADMEEVIDYDAITGNFDIIAKIQGIDTNDIGAFTSSEIAPLEGVERVITYNVVKF